MAATYEEQTVTTPEEVISQVWELSYPEEIRKMFNDRISRIKNLDPEIDEIVFNTERTVKGFLTNKREFIYKNGSFVKSGRDYHIHYTKYNDEYFMTGVKHNKMSRVIYPYDFKQTNHGYYNTLNKQSPLYISSQATVPTEEDYDNGSFTRYFAQKANEKQSPVFEVSVDVFGSSPLYEYISLNWYITGAINVVFTANSKEVFKAQRTLPNIKKILTPFQYYRLEENLSTLDKIRNKIAGMADFLANSNYNTNTLSSADDFGDGTGGDGSGGLGGTCSLGPQYTTKEACIAAGGTWSESGLLDSDGNYTSAADADGQLYDANGNPLENQDDICKK